MRKAILLAVLLCFLFSSLAFSQGGGAQLGGVVTDQSGAILPGVTITVTNTETGVVTTAITNESGAYNFPSLQPGKAYTVGASLPSFQTKRVTDLELGVSSSNRQNFQLVVSTQSTTVDVKAEPNAVITAAGASVGDVLSQERIQSLPLVGNNVLDLLEILPGFRINMFGDQFARIGGQGIDTINVTRDGMTVTDNRFMAGKETAFDTLAIDPDRPLSTAYTGSVRQLSTTTLNPELVGEIRMILSPVDAELGRGNSQVQIQTRSGTNKYTGSAVWNVRNSALNANTWGNNNDTAVVNGVTVWQPTKPDWQNANNYTLSYGGPIIRNKTFFFVSWNQNISNTRTSVDQVVLTDTAKKGIFRYWEGWAPIGAQPTVNPTTTGSNPSIRSTDAAGNPLRPATFPDGTAYTGSLVCVSVFGNLKMDGSPLTKADCPDGVDISGNAYTTRLAFPSTTGTVWDTARPGSNTTGYITKILALTPSPNRFITNSTSDGLNYADFRWLRGRKGNSTNEAVVGSDAFTNQKQINIKIDQNWGIHRISGNWSYQRDDSTDNVASLPDGLSGANYRRPQTLTINGTSTISRSLLNEARFGINFNKTASVPAWKVPNQSYADQAKAFLVDGGTRAGVPYSTVMNEGVGSFALNGAVLQDTTGTVTDLWYRNPAYTYADTVSWSRGKHSFKFGADVRLTRSRGSSLQALPVASYGGFGNLLNSPFDSDTDAQVNTQLGGECTTVGTTTTCPHNLFSPTTRDRARDLAYLLTDSIGGITPLQNFYWIEKYSDVTDGFWQDTTTRDSRFRETVNAEYAFFVKDDYKLRRNLTLNLGLRYEYYSPPYIKSGLTSTLIDNGNGLFGAARGSNNRDFSNWLTPGGLYLSGYGNTAGGLVCATGATIVLDSTGKTGTSNCDPNLQTQIQFVGPNSPNPGQTVIPRDRNNFGPAVGFAWQVPFFGEGKTTVRGGFQLTFQRTNVSEGQLAAALGGFQQPVLSTTNAAVTAITSTGRAVLASDLPSLVPANVPSAAPGQTIPIYNRSASTFGYSSDFSAPYTENFTLSVTRSLSRNMTLDVRYIGTLARNQSGSYSLNTNNVLYNPELFDALDQVRKGGNPQLLDQMLAGLRLVSVPNTGTTLTNCIGGTLTGAGTSTAACTGGVGNAIDGVTQFAGDQMRASSTFRANLANGNLVAVANSLTSASLTTGNGSTILGGGQQTISTTGAVQRLLRNGCDRLANGLTNIATRCFPEDYMLTNGQLSTATLYNNVGYNNHHNLQVQYSLRPIQGVSFQSTYSWAKSLGIQGTSTSMTDPLHPELDYGAGGGSPSRTDPAHTFRMNGTFELPFGPNKLFFGNASGWLARAIERWSTSVIFNMSSGSLWSIGGAQAMRYANGRYVATEYFKMPKGQVEWNGNTGTFFGTNQWFTVPDPQCGDSSAVTNAASPYSTTAAPVNPLNAACTLNALAVAAPSGTPGSFTTTSGQNVVYALKNPKPGQLGTVANSTLVGFGIYYLDANISKTFRVRENMQMSLRMDATNVLNHPQVDIPTISTGTTAFGNIAGKNSRAPRNFQAQVRLSF